MYNYNETKETKKEVTLRGRMTMMACDIEFSMLCIIMYCNPDPNNHTRAGKFKGMMMAEKIDCVRKDMKKYKKHYFTPLKEFFDGLDDFRKVRNDICHCVGKFKEGGIFEVSFIEFDENGIERMAYKGYTEDAINVYLDNFSKINSAFFYLWRKLEKEYNLMNQRNPFVHPSVDTSDSNP